MDHIHFDAGLRNLERASRLEAENHTAKAEAAKDDLAGLSKLWPMGYPEAEAEKHKDLITKEEAEAKDHLRVADHAAAGYVAPMHWSAEWMGKHANLVSAGYEHGRAKTTETPQESGMY